MAPARILFRVDAGSQVGLGHLQRCVSLALALRHAGARCVFATNEDPTVRRRLSGCGFESHDVHGKDAGPQFVASVVDAAARTACEVVILDSYRVEGEDLRQLRAAGLFVAAIDDLARFPFACQVVVNGGAHARQQRYLSSSGDTSFLLGPEYALLNPAFWDVPRRSLPPSVQRVLVTVGGTDPHNLMPQLVDVLDEVEGDVAVTAVVGPFFLRRDALIRVLSQRRRPVRLIEAADNLLACMRDADLAISAAGQTLYELMAAGTPAIAVVTADNQMGQAQALAAQGVVDLVGDARQEGFRERLQDALRRLCGDSDRRGAMSRAGQHLVDGQGAVRVARALLRSACASPVSARTTS